MEKENESKTVQIENYSLNFLYTQVNALTEKMNNEYVLIKIANFNEKIETDFDQFEKYGLQKKEGLQNQLHKIWFYAAFVARKKTFYRALELSNKYRIDNDDYEEYKRFYKRLEQKKYNIMHLFNIYYDIVLRYKQKLDEFKEFYTFYHTMILGLIYLTPENYQNDLLGLLESEHIEELKLLNRTAQSNLEFNKDSFTFAVIDELEEEIKNFIMQKYNIDVYEYEKGGNIRRI